jgi:hypothetical protein
MRIGLLAPFVLTACMGDDLANSPEVQRRNRAWQPTGDFMCATRAEDQNGYLDLICRHLVRLGSFPVNPNILRVEAITRGGDGTRAYSEQYSNPMYDFVFLSCCGAGDVVVIHVNSRTIVEWHEGSMR